LKDIATQQVRRAEDLSIKARDYSVTVDRILDDYCRVAGASCKEVAPTLNAEEIAQLRDFTDKLSAFSGVRKEFTEAARLAELSLHQTTVDEATRALAETRHQDTSVRPIGERPSQAPSTADRSDRDRSSRGR
jgi:hypothetical protein